MFLAAEAATAAVATVGKSALGAVDYWAIGGYLALMIFVGIICRKVSHNISDYIRMGGKSTWWLAGLSVFMQSFSCLTFTAYAGQAYLAGWSIMVHYGITAVGFFIQAAIFAPWMRQTRAITPLDAIRLRFGPAVEQITMYLGLIGAFIWGGMYLLSLATFTSTVFAVPIISVILIAGVVLVFYSVSGGSWSVQITDNLQSFLLLPMTVVMAVLALKHVGWIGGLFHEINAQGLMRDFMPIKSASQMKAAEGIVPMFYTVPWLAMALLSVFVNSANIGSCYRYLSVKNGPEARKAAMLAGILTLLGSFIWIIPAMVARLKFPDAVEALPMEEGILKAEGAYAVAAIKLLPPGLLGLMVVAMGAAAMSSMDSNLTGTAGWMAKNLYRPLARRLGYKPLEGSKLLLLTKLINLGLGIWAIYAAYLFSKGGNFGIFGKVNEILAMIGIPLGMSFVVSFLMRRVPFWSTVVGMVCGGTLSIILWLGGKYWGWELYWHTRVWMLAVATLTPTVLTRFFWFTASAEYRKRVDDFFIRIKTPIDLEKEVGKSIDHSQLKTVGGLGLLMAGLVFPLIFFAQTAAGKLSVLFVFAFIFVICGIMYLRGRKFAGSLADQVEDARAVDEHEDENLA